ncbi:sensor histidine kinase [Olivibacter sitiensis]|uniref:sensor histidine kinase n=1 Tax=Olivibacter sitiensis TaxID=376470 RepID=UPI000684EF66|nr:histidine kinase [Olivibacter sitiensis]
MERTTSKKTSSWTSTNLRYGLLGIGIGFCVYLLNCLFRKELLPLRYLFVSVSFGLVITFVISNIIYVAHATKILRWENVWLGFPVYYLLSLAGMLVGVELTYAIISPVLGWSSTFPHWGDYPFDAFLVLLVCTIIYISHYRKALIQQKFQEKELELTRTNALRKQAELDALQAKINPHFLYNALNSIVGLIKQDPQKAEQMTINLATLFRHSMNYQQESLVPLSEEMDLLNTYLEIERIRFAERISFQVEMDHSLQNVQIPRFLLQPLVENALKHGLAELPRDGLLKVRIFRENAYLFIQVIDNGKPFPDDLQVGYGLQSTFDKINLLYKGAASVELINKPEKMIQIKIPLV